MKEHWLKLRIYASNLELVTHKEHMEKHRRVNNLLTKCCKMPQMGETR